MTLQQHQILNQRYKIIALLGQGGFGAVYRAVDMNLNRMCAVKENLDTSQEAQHQFEREARILANLIHPNLARVTDYFFVPGQGQYLVMDYVEGEDLHQMMMRLGRPLPEAQVLPWIAQICDALTYLHSQRPPIIHRDIKPSNIKITPQGQAVLVDFGIAKFYDPGLRTTIGARAFTPGYSPPEQYGHGQTSALSDIYALGATLYTLLTGRVPSDSVDLVTGSAPPLPPPRSLNPQVSPAVSQAVMRAMSLERTARFNSASDFREALLRGGAAVPPSYVGAPPTMPPLHASAYSPQASTRRAAPIPWGWLAVIGGILALAGLVAVVGLVIGLSMRRPTTPIVIGKPSATRQSSETPAVVIAPPSSTPTLRSPDLILTEAVYTVVAQLTQAAYNNALLKPSDTPSPTFTPTLSPSPTRLPPSPTLSPSPTLVAGPLRLAFVRGTIGLSDIYVADDKGSGAYCVACNSCDEAEPAWSPDGQYLVYQSNCGGSYDIWMVSVYGDNPIRLTMTDDADEREPAWSPDGSRIVFKSNPKDENRNEDGDLWTIDSNGNNWAWLGTTGRGPAYSPDGKKLAFMSKRTGLWQIFTLDFATNVISQITNCSVNCRWPSWSPDGQFIAYNVTLSASTDPDGIWYTPVAGGSPVEVVKGGSAGRPSWSNSGWLAFNSPEGIEIVQVDGSKRQILVGISDAWAPCWSR